MVSLWLILSFHVIEKKQWNCIQLVSSETGIMLYSIYSLGNLSLALGHSVSNTKRDNYKNDMVDTSFCEKYHFKRD